MTLYVGDCRRCGAKKMSFDVYGVSTVFARSAHRPNERSTRIELACKCHDCHTSTLFVLEADDLSWRKTAKDSFWSERKSSCIRLRGNLLVSTISRRADAA